MSNKLDSGREWQIRRWCHCPLKQFRRFYGEIKKCFWAFSPFLRCARSHRTLTDKQMLTHEHTLINQNFFFYFLSFERAARTNTWENGKFCAKLKIHKAFYGPVSEEWFMVVSVRGPAQGCVSTYLHQLHLSLKYPRCYYSVFCWCLCSRKRALHCLYALGFPRFSSAPTVLSSLKWSKEAYTTFYNGI
jgi:hypothetical protein